jgi:voltage-gated potassium channel
MEALSASVKDTDKGVLPRWNTFWQIASDLAFDVTAKYGYGPARFLLLSGVFFLLIAFLGQFLWSGMGMMHGGAAVTAASFLDSLYYCMLLITTLGFSDLIPTTQIGKTFAVGCALFGLSWVGLFTAILVKRVIR